MAILLDGKALSHKIRTQIKEKILLLPKNPHLVALLSYPDPASELYVKMKQEACQEVGVRVTIDKTPYTHTNKLITRIQELNLSKDVHGVLIQLPLHPEVNTDKVLEALDPAKDVDGLTPLNMGKLASSLHDGFIPCTPLGIWTLLKAYAIPLEGKQVTILGRSRIVGTPLSLLLSRSWPDANATVTLAHSKTKNIKELCQASDIIISAVGHHGVLSKDMVRDGAVVVDVGINRIPHPTIPGKFCTVGDSLFEEVKEKASYITPVPGGIGPMTIASLLENTYIATVRSK